MPRMPRMPAKGGGTRRRQGRRAPHRTAAVDRAGREFPRPALSVEARGIHRPEYLRGLAVGLLAWPIAVLIAVGLPLAAVAVLLGAILVVAARMLRRSVERRRQVPVGVRGRPEAAVPGSGGVARVTTAARPDQITRHAARGLADLDRWRRGG